MQDVRVRFPLDALGTAQRVGEAGFIRRSGRPDHAGSNPATLTDLFGTASQWARAAVLKTAGHSGREGSTPSLSAPLGGASRLATATAWTAVERQRLAGSTPVPSAAEGLVGQVSNLPDQLWASWKLAPQIRTCSWESRVSPKHPQRVRILPSLLGPRSPGPGRGSRGPVGVVATLSQWRARVRVPSGALLSWSSGVLAALIRRRPWVQIPPRVLPPSPPGGEGS
jgi:hypothetical protein